MVEVVAFASRTDLESRILNLKKPDESRAIFVGACIEIRYSFSKHRHTETSAKQKGEAVNKKEHFYRLNS